MMEYSHIFFSASWLESLSAYAQVATETDFNWKLNWHFSLPHKKVPTYLDTCIILKKVSKWGIFLKDFRCLASESMFILKVQEIVSSFLFSNMKGGDSMEAISI